MAKNSAVNLDITNNADGYDISGGVTPRKLTVTGADMTMTGSGTNTYTFPAATDTLVGRASTDTLTNKTINANGTGNSITNLEVADLASGVLDTDLSSVSGSDDTIPSAKATKTALDGKQPLDTDLTTLSTAFASASASGPATLAFNEDTDNGTNKITIAGVASVASDKTLTLPDITDTLVTKTSTDVLTNKTLTTPVISTISNTGTLTLPTSTDTLVGRDTTDTLTNKTLTNPTVNFTDKAITQNVSARAYLGSNQSNLVSGDFTKVLLDTESWDIGSDFSTVNSNFVAPVTGRYLVSCWIRFGSAIADKLYLASIYVNGAEVRRVYTSIGSDSNGEAGVGFTDIFQVTATHTIELYARQVSGANTPDVIAGSAYTWMSVELISV